MGDIENRGGVVEVVLGERARALDLDVDEVALKIQPAAVRRSDLREFIDASKELKEEIYRVAVLIWGRAECSGTERRGFYPEREASPPADLQQLLHSLFTEQKGLLRTVQSENSLFPSTNRLLQLSARSRR